MKKLIKWLAKVFNVNIIKEKIVEKIVYKEKIVYISLEDEVSGNVTITGNLTVKGYLFVVGEVSCYKMKGN